MAKRPSQVRARPLDIFDDRDIVKATTALAAATAPSAALQPAPSPRPIRAVTRRDATPRVIGPEPSPVGFSQKGDTTSTPPVENDNAKLPKRLNGKPEAHVAMKLRVPRAMRSNFLSFKAELSAALGGVFLEDSTIARCVFELLLAGEDRERVLRVAQEREHTIRRPTNANPVAMAEFDAAIASLFADARKRKRRTDPKHDD